MKKILLGLVLILVLIGGGAYYLLSNLDALVKDAIETAGTEAVGSPVRVDAVNIDLASGSASIRGFTVANPEGFSDASMLSFEELSVVLDLANISSQSLGITSIVARNPRVLYENRSNTSNLDAVSERFAADPAASQDAPPESGNPIQLAIGNIAIEDIGASINSDLLPNPVEVSLGDINLRNLSGTPAEIAEQILRPVVTQLSRTAATALVNASADVLEQRVRAEAEETLDTLEDDVNSNLDEAIGRDMREGLGDLLRGNAE